MHVRELDELGKPYKIYAETLEDTALEQFVETMRQPCVVKGALMPDAHTGYTLPIGAVVACDGMVFPSFVGFDIGCGMCALPTNFLADDVREKSQSIFNNIYRDVPTGFAHNQKDTPWPEKDDYPRSAKMQEIFDKNGLKQLGSLGSGNHFAEIGVDEYNQVWIIVHSGSRGIGHAIATHYMRLASGDGKAREGHYGLDVTSQDGINYLMDMQFCLAFALENRREMVRRIEAVMQRYCPGEGDWRYLINRNHNHAEERDGLWIHRKGATHAEEGMMGVVPGNMRDGSFIVRGKGNQDSLCSSSHGAGRVLGRKEAARTLNIVDFVDTMSEVTALVTKDTLDESPAAYKDIFEVMRLQSDLVETIARVVPIINITG